MFCMFVHSLITVSLIVTPLLINLVAKLMVQIHAERVRRVKELDTDGERSGPDVMQWPLAT